MHDIIIAVHHKVMIWHAFPANIQTTLIYNTSITFLCHIFYFLFVSFYFASIFFIFHSINYYSSSNIALLAHVFLFCSLYFIYVTLHAKRGLKSLSVNREVYFTVSVGATKISCCEFKISCRVHLGLDLFHS